MKTAFKSLAFILVAVTIFSCQKEIEGTISGTTSKGSLQNDATGNCLGSAVSGTYKKDETLTASHFVNINVQVDSIGSYSISTDAVNGYSFRAVGSFTTTGVQVVKLLGSGKPLAPGTNAFTVTYNGTTCEFSVTVTGGTGGTSVYTIDCSSATLNGTFEAGTALTSSNTVQLNVNVTTAGSWSLATTATNGITFSGSGTFSGTGAQTITLTGSGTPSAGGNFNIPVNNGTSNCTFPVTFTAAAAIDWKFTEGTNTYQGTINSAQMNVVATISVFSYSGGNANGDAIVFALTDMSGGMNANETYNSASSTSNSSGFVFSAGSGEMYQADMSMSNVSLVFKVTSHNTSTKTIQGTFSGTVRNSANAVKTITNGTFKGTYQ